MKRNKKKIAYHASKVSSEIMCSTEQKLMMSALHSSLESSRLDSHPPQLMQWLPAFSLIITVKIVKVGCLLNYYDSSAKAIIASIITFPTMFYYNLLWDHHLNHFAKKISKSTKTLLNTAHTYRSAKEEIVNYFNSYFNEKLLLNSQGWLKNYLFRILLASFLATFIEKSENGFNFDVKSFVHNFCLYIAFDISNRMFLYGSQNINAESYSDKIVDCQKKTITFISNLMPDLFVEFKKQIKEHSREQYDKFIPPEFKSRIEDEKSTSIELFTERPQILTFSFPNKITKLKNSMSDFAGANFHLLMDTLAYNLNKEFSNLILEISKNNLTIIVLPILTNKLPNYGDFKQDLATRLSISAEKIKQATNYQHELIGITAKINCTWRINYAVDQNGYLQATLLYTGIHDLTAKVKNSLIDAGFQAKEQDNDKLIVSFTSPGISLPLFAEKIAQIEVEETKKFSPSKPELPAEPRIYYPLVESNADKNVSCMDRFWGFSARMRRYTSSLWRQSSAPAAAPKPVPMVWDFGEYGQYHEDKADKSVIHRLNNKAGIKTNEFFVVAQGLLDEIKLCPAGTQTKINKYLDEAKIVPHSDGKQLSGFVFTHEALKDSNAPVLIKLDIPSIDKRLYATTAKEYKQANGKLATLYLLNKFENIHGRTHHQSRTTMGKHRGKAVQDSSVTLGFQR